MIYVELYGRLEMIIAAAVTLVKENTISFLPIVKNWN